MGRLPEKTTAEIVHCYIAQIEEYPLLSPEEEAEIIRRWKSGDDEALQTLLRCNLRHVIYPAQRVAWAYYEKYDYWPAVRELIGAGNYGLLLAADRFRPDAGVRFITASAPSIRREIISKAKLDAKGRGVTRPYDVKFSPDILLDGLRGSTDSEIEIPDGPVPPRRSLCIIPNEGGKQSGGGTFSGTLAQGFARLNAAKTDTPPLTLQVWGDIKRFRYERPALPTKLKIIAEDNGVSAERVSQVGFDKAGRKTHAAVMSSAGGRRITPFPKWHNIDAWCDLPKKRRDESMADWCGDQPSSGVFSLRGRPNVVDGGYVNARSVDRAKKQVVIPTDYWHDGYRPQGPAPSRAPEPFASSCCHVPSASRMVPVRACDYNLKRIEAALDAGREIPEELQFTTPDGYCPALHFAKIVIHRRAAAKEDQERAARVERFKKLKEAELVERCARRTSVTLTTKGYQKALELEQDRQAANGSASSARDDQAVAAKKSSAA